MKKAKKLLISQMELLVEKSKDCTGRDLSSCTRDIINISFELRQNLVQTKESKGKYDGEIRIKTRVDNSEVNKTIKKLKKAGKLAEKLAGNESMKENQKHRK